jgi:hypothetical protein
LFELKVTTVPADGAGPLRVTAPVEVDPPVTEFGDKETPVRLGGVIVRLDD